VYGKSLAELAEKLLGPSGSSVECTFRKEVSKEMITVSVMVVRVCSQGADLHIHIYTCMHIYMYTDIYTDMHIYMHLCVCVSTEAITLRGQPDLPTPTAAKSTEAPKCVRVFF
jgi:hypothetical protein